MDWVALALDTDKWWPLVNNVMNHRVPYNAVKFLSGYTTGGLSRKTRLHGVSSL
jgi:hypothetical protein